MNLNPFRLVKKLLYKILLSPICHSLIKSWTECTSDWWYDDYRLTHKKSDLVLWIANGRWYFNIVIKGSHKGGSPIGLFERHLLWHEYNIIIKISNRIRTKKLQAELIAKLNHTVEEPTEPKAPIPVVKKPRIKKSQNEYNY